MYNIDLDDLLCTHSVFCENNLLSKKKKPTTKPEYPSSSWQINLFSAKHCTFVILCLFLKSLYVTSLLPSVYMCVVVYFKECFILSTCFLISPLIFHKSCLSPAFFLFTSCSFDGNVIRCHGYMGHCVLVLFCLFALFLVWNLSFQILLLLLKVAWGQIKLHSKIWWSLIIALPDK